MSALNLALVLLLCLVKVDIGLDTLLAQSSERDECRGCAEAGRDVAFVDVGRSGLPLTRRQASGVIRIDRRRAAGRLVQMMPMLTSTSDHAVPP